MSQQIEVTSIPGLMIQVLEGERFEAYISEKCILQGRLPKSGKVFSAIKVNNKKYYVSFERVPFGKNIGISIYDTKSLLYTNKVMEENSWEKKRIKILNRKVHEKVRFGEIFFDNLVSAIISRLLP